MKKIPGKLRMPLVLMVILYLVGIVGCSLVRADIISNIVYCVVYGAVFGAATSSLLELE